MRKALPHTSEGHVVTSEVRRLLAVLLSYGRYVPVEWTAQYADLSDEAVEAGVSALRAGDSSLWTLLKDEVDEIHHAFNLSRGELGLEAVEFASFWRRVWAMSIYGSPQNLIVTQATVRHQLLTIDDEGLHKVTHAVTAAAYEAYCKAGRFDRAVTVTINGKLLREAISIE
jgi:hypothetical protein